MTKTAVDVLETADAQSHEQAPPCVMVIFGGAGDHTKRKLVPALHNLARAGLLRREFAVIGVARAEMTHEAFRDKTAHDLREFGIGVIDPEMSDRLTQAIYYLPGEFADPATYERLKAQLDEVDSRHGTQGNRLFTWPLARSSSRRSSRNWRTRVSLVKSAAPGGASSSRNPSDAISSPRVSSIAS